LALAAFASALDFAIFACKWGIFYGSFLLKVLQHIVGPKLLHLPKAAAVNTCTSLIHALQAKHPTLTHLCTACLCLSYIMRATVYAIPQASFNKLAGILQRSRVTPSARQAILGSMFELFELKVRAPFQKQWPSRVLACRHRLVIGITSNIHLKFLNIPDVSRQERLIANMNVEA